MSWSNDKRCLQCGAKLALHRQVLGKVLDDQFCSIAHRRDYRAAQDQLALRGFQSNHAALHGGGAVPLHAHSPLDDLRSFYPSPEEIREEDSLGEPGARGEFGSGLSSEPHPDLVFTLGKEADGIGQAGEGFADLHALAHGVNREAAPADLIAAAEPDFGDRRFAGTDFARPGFPAPAFAQPGFSQPSFTKPGEAERGFAESIFTEPVFSEPVFTETTFGDPVFSKSAFAEVYLEQPEARSAQGGFPKRSERALASFWIDDQPPFLPFSGKLQFRAAAPQCIDTEELSISLFAGPTIAPPELKVCADGGLSQALPIALAARQWGVAAAQSTADPINCARFGAATPAVCMTEFLASAGSRDGVLGSSAGPDSAALLDSTAGLRETAGLTALPVPSAQRGAADFATAAAAALEPLPAASEPVQLPDAKDEQCASFALGALQRLRFRREAGRDVKRDLPGVRAAACSPEPVAIEPRKVRAALSTVWQEEERGRLKGALAFWSGGDKNASSGKPVWDIAIDFWKHAPRDFRLLAIAIPILLALALHPSLPKLRTKAAKLPTSLGLPGANLLQASTPVSRNEDGTEAASGIQPAVNKMGGGRRDQSGGGVARAPVAERGREGFLATVKQGLAARAGVELYDDFRGGLDDWQSREDLSKVWSFDQNGFVRPTALALYRPSLPLRDYDFEFLGVIDKQALSWVVRAQDAENYYAVKLTVLKPGPLTTVGIVRYPVIQGRAGAKVVTRITMVAHPDTLYRIGMNVHDNTFLLTVQGNVVDDWTEPRLPRGGVGFFATAGEESRLRWVQVSHQYDMLGRLCAFLAPYNTQTTNGSW